jgi:hypothetical protein
MLSDLLLRLLDVCFQLIVAFAQLSQVSFAAGSGCDGTGGILATRGSVIILEFELDFVGLNVEALSLR